MSAQFQVQLLDWFSAHKRNLPWRNTADPYHILVSEIMLQQTQVSRVIPIYEQFLERFPTAHDLANAELAAVLQAWQGLGYNRRAKMLWECSKLLPYGKIPKDEEALRKLPGIGHYTAAAVLAFWANTDAVAIDTNIRRVHHRYFGTADEKLIRSTLPLGRARDWNSALMDFGSLVCTKNPHCSTCPLQQSCVAYTKQEFAVPLVKQAPFKDSNRFYRGRIIDLLRSGPKTQQELLTIGAGERVEKALSGLEKEKMIRKDGIQFSL